ncbi:3-deoxy-8-phosphooctulonate synthase [bacterium]|nr:3-deoxy-8-phosphooctulonate synthase [bacterium]MDA7672900.1 3-deoxy-8-phosphooctulonate synthase [Verrucomicrobiales bacterium]MDC0275600.1 3-deoxy-8-phosphooctulonate synthase [Verrucomicrobiales bacterium]MDC0322433.1 3-deoxy-8-phosphooctulonate synthase [Verrucomicrobiales bacterium]
MSDFLSEPVVEPLAITDSVTLGGEKPLFILGPCVIESEKFVRETAEKIKTIAEAAGAVFVFKASYDKANRSSVSSFRGMDCREGCALLADIGEQLGVPVTTDVHTEEQATIAGDYIDIIQIPAFLSRQTDLIEAAAKTDRVVNVKKGQFMAPHDVKNIATKLNSFKNFKFFFTERGVSFGYNTLVADMRSLYWMREAGFRVVFDATHSVQRPGGLGESSGGDGVLAPVLARAALATGCEGIFMETHPNPAEALSDGPNQVPLEHLGEVLERLQRVHAASRA